ncbi:hypothetical protein GCM10022267_80540 [Lentzea roselyniae]|uniref:Uncharacterized protein n=2 Tax=Lentzea roselyniae TaxID=531940 RepID=A0ABP7C738_9PSEU
MDEIGLAESLATAGLDYVGMVATTATYAPPTLVTFAHAGGGGEFVCAEEVAYDDPQRVAKLNAAWMRMCTDAGLFDNSHRFLVGVKIEESDDEDPVWWWAEVALMDSWDLAGAGAATGVLGTGAGYPAFVMLSLDGNVVVRAAREQGGVGIGVHRCPNRMPVLRSHGEWMADWPDSPEFTRNAIRRWLDAHPE